MRVLLYNNSSDPLVLDKSLSLIGSATASPYDAISVESPTLILSDLSVANVSKVNYMYIEDLGRYYNARLVMGNNGIYTAYGEVDPFMSFKSAILNLKCIIDRVNNSDIDNKLIADGSYTSQVDNFMQRYTFPESFGSAENILICAGGD